MYLQDKIFKKLYYHISLKTEAHKNQNSNNRHYNIFYTANEFVTKSFCYTVNYNSYLTSFSLRIKWLHYHW